MRLRTHATAPGIVTLLATALALTGCSADHPAPDATADRLAAALSTGELDDALFTDGSPETAYPELLGDLADAPRRVQAQTVTEAEGTAEAVLTWRWVLDGRAWEYDTRAELTGTDSGWAVRWSPAIVEPTLAAGESLDLVELPPERGDILGAGGTPLVTSRPVVRYGVDKTRVGARQAVRSARRVARILGVDPAAFVASVRAAGDKAFVEAVVLRVADARQVDSSFGDIPGAMALDDHLPLAPSRDFAAPILGRVGAVTAELVEESGGRLEAGDEAGLSGLQLRYDEQLTGTAGVVVRATDGDGNTRTLHTVEPVEGEPLATTLDERLQTEAERLLTSVPGASALVAVRPSSGALLAAANGPGNVGLNAATFGQYAPGSTFKLVTSLALLRTGLTPESTVDCPPDLVVDGKRFGNYSDYPAGALGRITLRRAVAHSCNTAFVGAREQVDVDALASAAEALGFGVDHDLGFPAYLGQVPEPAAQTEAAADLIGQGRILASPMAMAGVAASVQAGRTVVPHLVVGHEATPTPSVPLTRGEARSLRELAAAVVAEGSGSFLQAVRADGAKTGTAEFGTAAADGGLRAHAWMVAMRGDLAVAAFVENGASGSRTAGPLVEAFLRSSPA